jgi:hypothetical protein
MAGTIQNLEILAAGTHNASTGRVTITEDDLDKIVENFGSLQGSNVVKPHLKLGHTDAQKWFGQENGIPTLGWVTKVWKVGKKLLANIDGVPDALLDMFRQGRYHNVSSEIYLDPVIEFNGKKVSHVLSAIAVLGTEMPAVKDLAGLANALFASSFEDKVDAEPVKLTLTQEERNMFTQEQVDSLIKSAVKEAVAEETAKLSGKVDDLTTQLEVVTKRAETAEASVTRLQDENAKAEAIRVVDKAINDGKLLPKQKDIALAFMNNAKGVAKLSDGSEKSMAALFTDFIGIAGKQVDLTEKGSGKNDERKDFTSPAHEVDYKAKKLLSADTSGKLTYSAAMDKVLSDDDELKARYISGEAA